MARTIVLFDIDGTILRGDGAGRRAMEAALVAVFGTPGDPGYRYDGRTDRQIVRELMRAEGFEDATIDERTPEVLARYLEGLRAELATRPGSVRLLPGVPALVDAVEAHPDMVLGLLTGNVREGAEAKLAAAGLDARRFVVGAFGSDHEERPQLPAVAHRRAVEHVGAHVPGGRLVVIGDTPFDLQCGRAIGARAIGVATGSFTVAQLSLHEPWAVFADLSDTATVMRTLETAA